MGNEFMLEEPSNDAPKKKRGAVKVDVFPPSKVVLNRQNPGAFPEVPPVSLQIFRDWRGVEGADQKGSYYMVAKWNDIPDDIIDAIVSEGHGPGSYLVSDAAGNKSRWAVTPHHVRSKLGRFDAEPIDPVEHEEDRLEKALDMIERLRDRMEPPRAENPAPAAAVDWGKILMVAIPALQPLIKALTDRLSPSSPSSPSTPPAPPSPSTPPAPPSPSTPPAGDDWAALADICARNGVAPAELIASIRAHIEGVAS